MESGREYLGIPLNRPKVAFFEFTSCEGCQLQILNNESTLLEFLSLIEIVDFREAMTERSDDYEIAFVEGSITRPDEIKHIRAIRRNAATLVAYGSCACFGGVNQLKNRFRDPEWVKHQVYGRHRIDTLDEALPLEAVVPVDLKILGCPVKKEEVEKIVINIAVGKAVTYPEYPVCMECRANENICLFETGEACLGPVTRAGCDSWCTNNKFGCWGCRGPASDANMDALKEIMVKYDIPLEMFLDRLETFGGFSDFADRIRKPRARPAKKTVSGGRSKRG
jgi:coenzyme F420-reducing hydrogenase gamma subunit